MKEIRSTALKRILMEYVLDTVDQEYYYNTFPVIHTNRGFLSYTQFDGNISYHDTNYYCVLVIKLYLNEEKKLVKKETVLFNAFTYEF